jgi:hypothetical protein
MLKLRVLTDQWSLNRKINVGLRRIEQSLAADGAIACFSSNLFPFSLDADRAPQLKAIVRLLLLW